MAASDYTPNHLNYRLHLTGCPHMESSILARAANLAALTDAVRAGIGLRLIR